MEKHNGKPGADPVCFGSPSAVGEGNRSLVSCRNFSSAKTSPISVTQGWGKGSVCHRKSGGKEQGPGAGIWRSSSISSLIVNVWFPGIKVGISNTSGENSVPGCPQLLSVHSWKSWKNNEPKQWLKTRSLDKFSSNILGMFVVTVEIASLLVLMIKILLGKLAWLPEKSSKWNPLKASMPLELPHLQLIGFGGCLFYSRLG